MNQISIRVFILFYASIIMSCTSTTPQDTRPVSDDKSFLLPPSKINSTNMPSYYVKYSVPKGYNSKVNSEVLTTLGVNHIKGCGSVVWKKSMAAEGSYRVMCSSDGVSWTPYTVFTLVQKVTKGHY